MPHPASTAAALAASMLATAALAAPTPPDPPAPTPGRGVVIAIPEIDADVLTEARRHARAMRRDLLTRHGGPMVMFGRDGAGDTVRRCQRTDQPDGPDGEKRYRLDCTERPLARGESIEVYLRPLETPAEPEPPLPPGRR